jgi:hypothetical protein
MVFENRESDISSRVLDVLRGTLSTESAVSYHRYLD